MQIILWTEYNTGVFDVIKTMKCIDNNFLNVLVWTDYSCEY